MTLVVEKFVKKPLYVDVVLVTNENMLEAAQWCQGEIRDESDQPVSDYAATDPNVKKYIHVRVHNPQNVRQCKAFPGDRILYTPQGYKVYTKRAFANSFQPVEAGGAPVVETAETHDPTEPPKPAVGGAKPQV